MLHESRFAISLCPKIKAEENALTASTSWLVRVLTLGMLLRRVEVDLQSRTVIVEQRTCWLLHSVKVFPFGQIAAVGYGYEDIHPFASFASTHDAIDRFVVGIRIAGGDEVRLFFFLGDGVFTNDGPMPDWWYWDDHLMDFIGTQEQESKLFAQLLSKLIGVSIVPSTLTPE